MNLFDDFEFDGAAQDAVVTVSHRGDSTSVALAEQAAAKLKLPFVPRGDLSLLKIAAQCEVRFVLVAKYGLLHIADMVNGTELFFHPNMAHLRLKNLRQGLGDRMAMAMSLARGMSVLDCTLGLGSDAIVAAHIVGETGSVIALEDNPLLALVMAHAFRNFPTDNLPLQAAMRRIKVVCVDHGDFLPKAATDSYDVVYFDPMFRRPLKKSAAMEPLRPLSDDRELSLAVVDEAARVARRCVVLKEGTNSGEFVRLGFRLTAGGKYSKVGYGIIDV